VELHRIVGFGVAAGFEKRDCLRSAGFVCEAKFSRWRASSSCSQDLRGDPEILGLKGAGLEPPPARTFRYCKTW
jgi:hypothetical protein